MTKGAPIEFRVGAVARARVRDAVTAGQPLAMLHAASAGQVAEATHRIQAAYVIGAESVAPLPILLDRISGAA